MPLFLFEGNAGKEIGAVKTERYQRLGASSGKFRATEIDRFRLVGSKDEMVV